MDETFTGQNSSYLVCTDKKKNSDYKSGWSKGSEVDYTHTQIPVSLPMCGKLSIGENVLGVYNRKGAPV